MMSQQLRGANCWLNATEFQPDRMPQFLDMSSPAILKSSIGNCVPLCSCPVRRQGEIKDEVIERGPEIVDGLAHQDAEKGRHLDERLGLIERQLVRLRVEIKGNLLLAYLPAELNDSTLKLIEMAICPLYPVSGGAARARAAWRGGVGAAGPKGNREVFLALRRLARVVARRHADAPRAGWRGPYCVRAPTAHGRSTGRSTGSRFAGRRPGGWVSRSMGVAAHDERS